MGRSQSYAFFLLPTRAWELGVGGLVALVAAPRSARAELGPAMRRRGVPPLAWRPGAGSAWRSSWVRASPSPTPTWFPGYAAAVPVLGTALVIWCGTASPRRRTDAGVVGRPGPAPGATLVLGLPLALAAPDPRARRPSSGSWSLGGRLALVAVCRARSRSSATATSSSRSASARRYRQPAGHHDRGGADLHRRGGRGDPGWRHLWEHRPLDGGPAVAAEPLTAPPVFEDEVPGQPLAEPADGRGRPARRLRATAATSSGGDASLGRVSWVRRTATGRWCCSATPTPPSGSRPSMTYATEHGVRLVDPDQTLLPVRRHAQGQRGQPVHHLRRVAGPGHRGPERGPTRADRHGQLPRPPPVGGWLGDRGLERRAGPDPRRAPGGEPGGGHRRHPALRRDALVLPVRPPRGCRRVRPAPLGGARRRVAGHRGGDDSSGRRGLCRPQPTTCAPTSAAW